MSHKTILQPGPDHPIRIEPNPARVTVSVDGQVIADSENALTLWEANYPPVQYLPISDVDATFLSETDHYTYCPYKGDCSYYSVTIGGERTVNAVWTYEVPYPSVAEIRGHVAFYPNRVEIAEAVPTVTNK
jgi:uncharacterized protein (DUF427 family)